MSWIERRKQITNRILMSVQNADTYGLRVLKENLIAQVQLQYGSARKKVLEYIKVLVDTNRIKESWIDHSLYLELVKKEIQLEL